MNKLFRTARLTAIGVAFLSFGCKETELPVPLGNNSTQLPSPSAPVPDDQPLPAPGTPTPPSQSNPPAPTVPSLPGLTRKIKWAPLDYKEFEYNTQGGLVKYSRQYNSVQGTDIVRRDEFTYAYNADGKITTATTNNGIRTEYTYSGDVWSEALSYDKLNRPFRKYHFQFNTKKQLTEYSEFYVSAEGTLTPRAKTSFTYNAAGNLVRYTYFWYVESSRSFVRSTELEYSNFDLKKFPKNAISFSDDVLQPLTFFVNNPGKKEILSSYAPIEYYSYSYNENGYPTRRRTTYTYHKPLPALDAEFEY